MHCIFIGGPLDGELREVPDDYCDCLECNGRTNSLPEYQILNGIARHESVSEEEVARRVYRWMSDCRSEPQLPGE